MAHQLPTRTSRPRGHSWRCTCAECKKYNRYRQRMSQQRVAKMDPPHHGDYNIYRNYGCRCEACSKAWSVKMRENRERRKLIGPKVHGAPNGHSDYNCYCVKCKATRNLIDQQNKAYGRPISIHSSDPREP